MDSESRNNIEKIYSFVFHDESINKDESKYFEKEIFSNIFSSNNLFNNLILVKENIIQLELISNTEDINKKLALDFFKLIKINVNDLKEIEIYKDNNTYILHKNTKKHLVFSFFE
jgi:hypothetical protein